MHTKSSWKSPKLLVLTALTLAVAACVVAASLHAVRNRMHATGDGESAKLQLHSLVTRGSQLRDAGRYKKAGPPLREALALAEHSFGSNSFETANVLNELGMLGKYDGHFDEAEADYRRALDITEKTTSTKLNISRPNFG